MRVEVTPREPAARPDRGAAGARRRADAGRVRHDVAESTAIREPVPDASHFALGELTRSWCSVRGAARRSSSFSPTGTSAWSTAAGSRPAAPRTVTGDPVREFIRRMARGAPAARAVGFRFVALTHPHDDHYAGLARPACRPTSAGSITSGRRSRPATATSPCFPRLLRVRAVEPRRRSLTPTC
jgi:hypothetical protein